MDDAGTGAHPPSSEGDSDKIEQPSSGDTHADFDQHPIWAEEQDTRFNEVNCTDKEENLTPVSEAVDTPSNGCDQKTEDASSHENDTVVGQQPTVTENEVDAEHTPVDIMSTGNLTSGEHDTIGNEPHIESNEEKTAPEPSHEGDEGEIHSDMDLDASRNNTETGKTDSALSGENEDEHEDLPASEIEMKMEPSPSSVTDTVGNCQIDSSGMDYSLEDITLGLDLVGAARNLLVFLHKIYLKPELTDPNSRDVAHAIYRYEKLWLPLAVRSPFPIAAPFDVEWVWFCHMLSPVSYHDDCLKVIGTEIPHVIASGTSDRENRALEQSKLAWNDAYPETSFDTDLSQDVDTDEAQTNFSYDIRSAIVRQSQFYYHVSLSHYRDQLFLENAVLRYTKFLHLKRVHPEVLVVPYFDIDLIWHAHQRHSHIYRADSENILGYVLNHDDSFNDRGENSPLKKNEKETETLWGELYSELLDIPGSMYRGPSSDGVYDNLTTTELDRLITRTGQVKLTFARLSENGTSKMKLHYTVEVSRSVEIQSPTPPIMYKLHPGQSIKHEDKLDGNTFPYSTENDQMKELKFCIKPISRVPFASGGDTKNGTTLLPSLSDNEDKTFEDDVNMDPYLLRIGGRISKIEVNALTLRVSKSPFLRKTVPSKIEDVWGVVPFTAKSDTDTEYLVGTHALWTHKGMTQLEVRVTHSVSMMQSGVQVVCEGRILASSHLIGDDQLAGPSQLSNQTLPNESQHATQLHLDSTRGQRALLVKGHRGDFAIVKGWWTGFKIKPRTKLSERELVTGNLTFEVHRFSSGKNQRFEAHEKSLEMDGISVNTETGHMKFLSPTTLHLAEEIALILSVQLLHVLCQPRRESWKPQVCENGLTRPRLPYSDVDSWPDDLAMLAAAGLNVAAPSNFYISTNQYTFDHCPVAEVCSESSNAHSSEQSRWSAEAIDSTGVVGSEAAYIEPKPEPPTSSTTEATKTKSSKSKTKTSTANRSHSKAAKKKRGRRSQGGGCSSSGGGGGCGGGSFGGGDGGGGGGSCD